VTLTRVTSHGIEQVEGLEPLLDALQRSRDSLRALPVRRLVDLFDDYSARLLKDERTRRLEAVMFLAAWLRRDNLLKLLELNLNGNPDYLDRFVPYGRGFLAAKPHGLVATWMAGNVGTLPMFSLVPALLTKNVCLLKLASVDPEGMDRLLGVLGEAEAGDLRGHDLLESVAVVSFDHQERSLSEGMSRHADVKVMWGGQAAIAGIRSLPTQEHCVEIIFGPKYSIGVIDRKLIEGDAAKLDDAVGAFVRDMAIFDQRACSAPQTTFIERNARLSLHELGESFARHFARLGPKPALDSYTTMQILNARAEWALDIERDVITSSDGANWTVCMDRVAYLKEAVQSRTLFLTEVGSLQEVVPLLSPKVQTIGIAFSEVSDAAVFAEAATAAGAARCVRPGLMNAHESPWDGKLLINQLVRWVSLKP
jgi:Acyl-CoA reductase (LuxC)